MSASESQTGSRLEKPSGSLPRRIVWHWRHDPKRELWIAWWTMVVFYQLFGLLFVIVTRTMPPPKPWWEPARVAQWFDDNHGGLLIGFAFLFLISGMTAMMNALIAYSMRRMSVSRAFAYSYLVIYALSTLPGMLLYAIALTVGAMRPDRDPELIRWLYDFAFMSFDGTMGVFLVGSLVWMVAILLDKNRVFPKWFGYFNLCNALTEVVIAPAWIFKEGVFAWNGAITWWFQMVVFGIYTGVFITLLRRMILREDFGTGPLPELLDCGGTRAIRLVGSGAMTNATAEPVRFVPGQPDMWAFVLFEALLFTAYFTVYVICRTQNVELFLQSQTHLDLHVGGFNTLVLLASSWSVARCVQASRERSFDAALTHAFLTMFLGFAFLVSKVLEWANEIGQGFTFTTDLFFSFYYFLTALHFLHLLIGFVFLGVVVYQLRSPARRSQELVETGATYWHTIDFLWVMIFSLLYVMR